MEGKRTVKRIVPRNVNRGIMFLIVYNDLEIGNKIVEEYLRKYGESNNIKPIATYTTARRLLNRFPDNDVIVIPPTRFYEYWKGGKFASVVEIKREKFATPFSSISSVLSKSKKDGIKAVSKMEAVMLRTLYPKNTVGIEITPKTQEKGGFYLPQVSIDAIGVGIKSTPQDDGVVYTPRVSIEATVRFSADNVENNDYSSVVEEIHDTISKHRLVYNSVEHLENIIKNGENDTTSKRKPAYDLLEHLEKIAKRGEK